ncbi:MAG: hypothetical protein Fur0022_48080 [Anaerolineales bacterium]
MQSKKIKIVIGLIISLIFMVGVLVKNTNVAKAEQARELLNMGLTQIKDPVPGQIIRYSYIQYWRTPPLDLEPADPYHQPFSEIWPSKQFVDSWVEVNEDGYIVRSRTQLRSEDGTLLQDLYFWDGMQTDYFPLEIRADSYKVDEQELFIDQRKISIEAFLQGENLVREEGYSIDGKPVFSVYGDKVAVIQENIGEALVKGIHPFIADLEPVFQVKRLDFDPETSLAIGEANVILDKNGNEQIVAYQTFLEPEIVPADQINDLFALQIPEHAFRVEGSIPMEIVLNGLEEIAQYVAYPIYEIQNEPGSLILESATLTIPKADDVTPGFMKGIEFAPALGKGMMSIYVGEQEKKLTLIQGAVEDMQEMLSETQLTWINSDKLQMKILNTEVGAWKLTGLDPSQQRFVIEMGETLIYIEANHLDEQTLLNLIYTISLVAP